MRLAITLTPSNTPSNTPTITPTVSRCPDYQYYAQPNLFACNSLAPLPISGFTLEYNGSGYTNIVEFVGEYGATFCGVGSVDSPIIGQRYSFELTTLPAGWELCPVDNVRPQPLTYDRVDIILNSFLGEYCDTEGCYEEYSNTIEWYLNGVLQYSQFGDLTSFYRYFISNNPNCSPLTYLLFNQGINFSVRPIGPTPTPTNTSTATPIITPSNNSVCGDSLNITQTGQPSFAPQGNYLRITSYTGGTFNYGYLTGSTGTFFTGQAPDGNYYPIYELQSGSTYSTLIWLDISGTTDRWQLIVYTGGTSVINQPSGNAKGSYYITPLSTLQSGISYPQPGTHNFTARDWTFAYPAICSTPTATPTNTGTPTQTPTTTPLPSQTNTPTITQTSTPTNTSTQTPTNTSTPTPTRTPPVVYYKLDACAPATGQGYTNITPGVANQRYFDFVNSVYYVWDNTSTTTPGTIVSVGIVSGQSGCP